MTDLPFIPTDAYRFLCRFDRETIPSMLIRGASSTGKKRTVATWWGQTNFHTTTEQLHHESTTVEFQFKYDAESIWWDMQSYPGEDDIIFQHYLRNYMKMPSITGHRKFIIIDHAELLSELVMRRISTAIEQSKLSICFILLASLDIRIPPRLNSRIVHLRIPIPTMEMLDDIDRAMERTGTDGIRWLLYEFHGYVPIQHYYYYLISTDITMDHDTIFEQLTETMRTGQLTGPVIEEIRGHLYTLLGKLMVTGSRYMFILHWIFRTGLNMATTDEIRYQMIDQLRPVMHPMIAGSRDIILLEAAYWRVVGCLHQLL